MKRSLWAGAASVLLVSSCSHRMPDFSAAQKRNTNSLPAMQRQIENAIDAGEGDVVVRGLREKMSADPDNLEVRLQLAAHYRQQGYTELAAEHYRLAGERFPTNARVVLLLAQTLHEQNSTREAADLLDRFLAKNPARNADLPAWLGLLRDRLGDAASAESAHRAALVLNPSNAKLHNNLGYNLLMQGKRADAVAEFRRALALDPSMHTARNNLGLALMKDGSPMDRKEALEQWSTAASPAVAHNNLASALIEEGLYSEAYQELQAALTYQKNYLPALKNLELLASLGGKSTVTIPAPERKKRGFLKQAAWRFWKSVAGVEDKGEPRQGVTLAITK